MEWLISIGIVLGVILGTGLFTYWYIKYLGWVMDKFEEGILMYIIGLIPIIIPIIIPLFIIMTNVVYEIMAT